MYNTLKYNHSLKCKRLSIKNIDDVLNKKRLPLFTLLLTILCLTCGSFGVEVSNVSAAQRTDGSGLVDIYYTLSDLSDGNCEISLQISYDSGSTWDVEASSLTGDIGDGVTSGGKHIAWDSKADLPEANNSFYRVKVIAKGYSEFGTYTIDGDTSYNNELRIYNIPEGMARISYVSGYTTNFSLSSPKPAWGRYACNCVSFKATTYHVVPFEECWGYYLYLNDLLSCLDCLPPAYIKIEHDTYLRVWLWDEPVGTGNTLTHRDGQVTFRLDTITATDEGISDIFSIHNNADYGESYISIDKVASPLGTLSSDDMPRGTWKWHIPIDGHVAYNTTLDFSWETDSYAKIEIYATAYGPNGSTYPKLLYSNSNVSTGSGSNSLLLGSGNPLPGDENTYEVVFSAYIFNGEYDYQVPNDTDYDVLTVSENLRTDYRPQIPNIASAKRDWILIRSGEFENYSREKLLDIYNRYMNVYTTIRNEIKNKAQAAIEDQIWDVFGFVFPEPVMVAAGAASGRYSNFDALLLDISKAVLKYVKSDSGLDDWLIPQVIPYMLKSAYRVYDHEKNCLELQYYIYIIDYVAVLLDDIIATATDGEYPGKVVISWTPINNATQYTVYRSTQPDSSDISILFSAVYAETIEDTTIEPGRTYYYSVRTEVDGKMYFSEADAGFARHELNFTLNSSHGNPVPEPDTYKYIAGASVPPGTVQSPADQTNTTRYICTGYYGTGSAPSGNTNSYTSFAITEESSITWKWNPQYMVTATAGNNGYLTLNPSGWHDRGTSITVSAQPNNSYEIDRWIVNGVNVQNGGVSLSLNNISNAKNIFVIFSGIEINFSIVSEHGESSPEIGSYSYVVNDIVPEGSVNSPADDNGSQRFICSGFEGTGDAPSGRETSYSSFSITQDSCIIWQWYPQYMVSMDVAYGGSIVENPAGWKDTGSSIDARIQPQEGFGVNKWYVNGIAYQDGGESFSFDNLNEPVNIYADMISLTPLIAGDITGEGLVNLRDFTILASQWLASPGVASADVSEPCDGYVDYLDLIVLAESWLSGN
ncbi:hypothetical protein SMSP2_01976 [Limihaloglobus sulfuriphilus]|uniref:Bacterial repeat domain-containing protein n=1 Tax=Limihaloglobus sulfuriphilus TaxID=1851148 RepID=A0A1Q2MFZ5_9BACT|nr:hypothetical protein [Limihaloglobus sulfuriphilus]AQQ71600.1 hypothetical protein SMSP2_01976 [Limihaloglobus sulfuriphilus]